LVEPHAHSALATILLDDSPLKANLQPWNHVCIPEYSKQMRANDLRVLEGEKSRGVSDSNKEGKKKKKKKGKGKGDHGSQAPESSSPISSQPQNNGPKKYDETLLAVVGVLDAIKGESNVSGWIRAGGLWGVGVDGCEGYDMVPSKEVAVAEVGIGESGYREVDSIESRLGIKRKWKSSEEIRDKRENSTTGCARNEDDHVISTVPPDDSSPPLTPLGLSSSPTRPSFEHPSSMVWFEHPPVAEYWATRGRRALKDLGIDDDAGVF
jgi:hypothetical protein